MHEINHPNPKKALTFILILLDIFIGEKIIFEEVSNKNKDALNHHGIAR